jgi:hypothetical protein
MPQALEIHEVILAAFVGGVGQARSGGTFASSLYAQLAAMKRLRLREPEDAVNKVAACRNALECLDQSLNPGLAGILYREMGDCLHELSWNGTSAYQKAMESFRRGYLLRHERHVRRQLERLAASGHLERLAEEASRQYCFDFGPPRPPQGGRELLLVQDDRALPAVCSPLQLSLPLESRPQSSTGFSAVRLVGLAIPFSEGSGRPALTLASPPRARTLTVDLDHEAVAQLAAPCREVALHVEAPERVPVNQKIQITVRLTSEFALRLGHPTLATLPAIRGVALASSSTLRFTNPSLHIHSGGVVTFYAYAETATRHRVRISFQHAHGQIELMRTMAAEGTTGGQDGDFSQC